MGWDRHKLLWDGTDKYVPWTTLQIWHGWRNLQSTEKCLAWLLLDHCACII